MQQINSDSGFAELNVQANDLGPLAWVLDELRKSLDSATKALRRFVRDAEMTRGSDLAALDSSQLRISRQQLHQAVGALEMVGFSGPALVLRGMEAVVQKFVQRPDLCNEMAANKIERASFALTGYLETVLAGKQISAVALFPQYNDVQEMAGATRSHPADLWAHDWRWVDVVNVQPDARDPTLETRAAFDKAALQVMKLWASAEAHSLADISATLANGAAQHANLPYGIFWRIAAGFFDAIATSALRSDVHSKRAVSRVLTQLAAHTKGDFSISDRLAHDLLFFCTQAEHSQGGPYLQAVREAYELLTYQPLDYSKSAFGQYDPALLVQARKRITAAKETWSSLTAGDTSKFKTAVDQFGLISDSLGKLLPQSGDLASAMTRCVDGVAHNGRQPEANIAMEMATSVLYLEATLIDFDPHDTLQADRAAKLAHRLEAARSGGQIEPLESWMEDLYRRVSDRQTMGSVVGELKTSLGEVEKSMDQFFRDPSDKACLSNVPSRLAQMRGVLSVLGLDHASVAVLRMRDSVEQILVTEVDEVRARATGTFDRLGGNLGALGFLIDMLSYQPVLAKKLFVFDEMSGELKPLMGRSTSASQLPASGASQQVITSTPAENLVSETSQSFVAVPNVLMPSVAVTPVEPETSASTEEDELLDIFLEEAREVIGQGRAALTTLANTPSDLAELTSLRRAFHTLKGSSRMVGLHAFGEAGWSLEQLFNTWLADQKPATDVLGRTASEALEGLAGWIEDIAGRKDSGWTPAPFRASADSLRLNGQYLQLDLAGMGTATDTVHSIDLAEPLLDDVVRMDAAAVSPVEQLSPSQWQTGLPSQAGELPPFDLKLDVITQAPADISIRAPLQASVETKLEPIADQNRASTAVESSEVDFDFDIAETSTDANASDLISAEEMAAFERALNEIPDIGVSDDSTHPAVSAAEVTEIQDIDFAALQAISSQALKNAANHLLPALNPEDAKSFAATDVVNEFADFENISTEPAPLRPDTPDTKPSDLDFAGFNFSEKSTPVATPSLATELLSPLLSVESAANDDQFKAIGPLRISLPLYNVYLNEADEWSRRLVTSLSEWALEVQAPVPDAAVAFTHSLAGSSATVGFLALSGLARSLENALQHAVVTTETGGPSAHLNASVFIEAAEEIRRLLHQFAAGLLKEPHAGVISSLEATLQAPDPATALQPFEPSQTFYGDSYSASTFTRQANEVIGTIDTTQDIATTSASSDHIPPLTVTVEPLATVTVIAETKAVQDLSAHSSDAQLHPNVILVNPPAPLVVRAQTNDQPALQNITPLVVTQRVQVDQIEFEDDIDAVDAIDQDLFPIFEEEAAELFPQIGGALRQWISRPTNMGARSEVLRGLHTMKGSARLAGALRLGEMAHRMESDMERLGEHNLGAADIEPLQGQMDVMQAAFDRLRHPVAAAETSTVALQYGAVSETPVTSTHVTSTQPEITAPTVAVSMPLVAKRLTVAAASTTQLAGQPQRLTAGHSVRVRSQLLDRLVNQAGEVMITRSRLETELGQLRGSLGDLTGNLDRLRQQLRDIEVQAETQMQSRMALAKETNQSFDPLEFDRFTRVQELTRMMAESVNDVATVQRNIQRTVEATEDDLVAQARQTRELQRDLLRTRMVEFEGISDRLYRVVRQAGKDTGKQVKLDITGGSIEMDRGVLDRMTPAFEHLLRNCVAHGIEDAHKRTSAGKDASGQITISLHHEGNDVSVEFSDDGAGLNLARIRERALEQGLISHNQNMEDGEAASLIFTPGFSTVTQVTELAGRGIGMDVVRSEVNALGGRIETSTVAGKGTTFKLVLPLTTAVTQVVMIRVGKLTVGVPATLIETVRRASAKDVQQAYNSSAYEFAGEALPFFWAGALLQHSRASDEPSGKTMPVLVFKSAAQRVAAHVDEVLGNQEVVVKNLGPQLSRLPGLAGMTVLASGAVALIYNPVALAAVYGDQAHDWSTDKAQAHMLESGVSEVPGAAHADHRTPAVPLLPAAPQIPLILVVDDSITVRRVTQRLLQREGYRVAMAADGLQALARLAEELPAVVLSDIEMPRMDGFDLARNIKADPRLAPLPIIMITSRIAEKHREHAAELGVNHYLGKPYSEEELLSLIKRYTSQLAAV